MNGKENYGSSEGVPRIAVIVAMVSGLAIGSSLMAITQNRIDTTPISESPSSGNSAEHWIIDPVALALRDVEHGVGWHTGELDH